MAALGWCCRHRRSGEELRGREGRAVCGCPAVLGLVEWVGWVVALDDSRIERAESALAIERAKDRAVGRAFRNQDLIASAVRDFYPRGLEGG
jgi:hypothetical protein